VCVKEREEKKKREKNEVATKSEKKGGILDTQCRQKYQNA
jgi:hypothetical protein